MRLFLHLIILTGGISLAGCSTAHRGASHVPSRPSSEVFHEITMQGEMGPTLRLAKDRGASPSCAIAEFMYFVPLISPEPVTIAETDGNTQRTRILSAKRRSTAVSLSVTCEFEITGQGALRNTCDRASQVRRRERRLKENGVLERQLAYIGISGAGRGRIEVEGVLSNGVASVTEVRLRFNDKGRASPVTIGLHDIRLVDGQPAFENEMVASVNALTFHRSASPAKMEVSVSAIKREGAGDSVWQKLMGSVTGMAANLLLKPITVDKAGNDAILDFGNALATRQSSFTFPRAKNLRSP